MSIQIPRREDMVNLGWHDSYQFGISKELGLPIPFVSVVIGQKSSYHDIIKNDKILYCGQNLPNNWNPKDGVFGENKRKLKYRNWILLDALYNQTDINVFLYTSIGKDFTYTLLDKTYKVNGYSYTIENGVPDNIVFVLK